MDIPDDQKSLMDLAAEKRADTRPSGASTEPPHPELRLPWHRETVGHESTAGIAATVAADLNVPLAEGLPPNTDATWIVNADNKIVAFVGNGPRQTNNADAIIEAVEAWAGAASTEATPPRTADQYLNEEYTYVEPRFAAAFREGWNARGRASTEATERPQFDNETEACRHCPTPDVHPRRVGGELTYEAEATERPDLRAASRDSIYSAIDAELDSAYAKHGDLPWGRHEFYAILAEEVDELWDAIKGDEPLDRVVKEAVQVAAMVIRYCETGDRYQGPAIEAWLRAALTGASPSEPSQGEEA